MAPSKVCLSSQTAAQLKRQLDPSTAFYPIEISGTIVGLCLSRELPSRVALPAGLELGKSPSTKEDLNVESIAPDIIALRYRATLNVRPSAIDETVQQCKNARLIMIDGKPFMEDQQLGDLVSERGTADALEVVLFRDSNADDDDTGLAISLKSAQVSSKVVVVDAVAYCSPESARKHVIENIALAVHNLLTTAQGIAEDFIVNTAHYAILGGGFAVTVVSPGHEQKEEDGSASKSAWRRTVHEQFVLPMDRPLLRSSCQMYNASISKNQMCDGGWPGRLADVHKGIKPHGLGEDGVSVHLVQGKYLYCHYLQDKFNDSGWGCAYRSLQTIFSWCALEGYTSFADGKIPTHKDIQKALVDVGDKASSFIGSKEWIGANEVCYALEKRTGVSSKILHVSRGAEMETKGRELARHFDEQGSPVMVGGGVLAWTILGVARNSRTGKTKFLILDPHYEGRDDLTTIQAKGWVGWKTADVFKADAFYNLCMPLRPSGV